MKLIDGQGDHLPLPGQHFPVDKPPEAHPLHLRQAMMDSPRREHELQLPHQSCTAHVFVSFLMMLELDASQPSCAAGSER